MVDKKKKTEKRKATTGVDNTNIQIVTLYNLYAATQTLLCRERVI